MTKATLNLSPPLSALQTEAAAMGLSFTALLTADVVRYRQLAQAATPTLTDWQWGLLAHVLDGIEAAHILSGDDALPSFGYIAAEIDTWADSASDDDTIAAGALRKLVMTWTPITIAGVLLRLRR